MKLTKRHLKQIIREAMDDAPYIESAQLEDVVLECFLEWLADGDKEDRRHYMFNDFVEDVSDRMGLAGDDALKVAIEAMGQR